MYTIIGADQKEYGPVPADTLREWIRQQRANAQTLVRAEAGGDWQPLSRFPEFAADLAAQAGAAAASGGGAPAWSPESVRQRDYDLRLGECFRRSWQLLTEHLGLWLPVGLIFLVIEGAIAGLSNLPFLGPLFSLGHLVVVGPLVGGVYYVLLGTLRGQSREVGDVFAGFRLAFVQLFLGHLVPAVLAGLCLLPAVIAGLLLLLPEVLHNQVPTPAQFAAVGAVAVLGLIPAVFLHVNWKFTLPLIMDRRLDFWPAMRLSWQKVTQHWWKIFGLVLLVGLLNLLGLALCCVGLLFTVPLGFGAWAYAYETIFSDTGAPG